MIRFHPTLYIVIFMLFMTGNIALYAMLLISLYVHEMGHLFFAKQMNEKISSCQLTPYGGEITFASPGRVSSKSLSTIAIGGPIFTFGLLLILVVLPIKSLDTMIQLQWLILSVNLLPFLPLDGGQVLFALLQSKKGLFFAQRWMYRGSIVFFIMLTVGSYFYLPQTLVYMMLTTFLCVQNIQRYRNLRYENAIRKIMERKQYKKHDNC